MPLSGVVSLNALGSPVISTCSSGKMATREKAVVEQDRDQRSVAVGGGEEEERIALPVPALVSTLLDSCIPIFLGYIA